ncbi:MAG: amino acid ABC transporter substrate-binding protein, partial [Actinomyces sp.]
MNTPRTKRPILRYAAAALAMAAALGASACSPHSQSAPGGGAAGAQVGDRTPEQIKEAGEITIGIFSDKAPFGYIDADGKPAGYDVVYGDRIAADLGVTAKYVPVDAAART